MYLKELKKQGTSSNANLTRTKCISVSAGWQTASNDFHASEQGEKLCPPIANLGVFFETLSVNFLDETQVPSKYVGLSCAIQPP
jgi:hypothetical protein